MPRAVRATTRRLTVLPVLGGLVGWVTACPAPAPRGSDLHDAPTPGPVPRHATAEAAITPEPAPAIAPAPAPAPAPSPALAAEGVRPVVRATWQALEAVDAGDPDAMARVMTEDARWFPPGSLEESVGAGEARRALSPWSGDDVALDVRRIIDLDGAFAAQVTVAGTEGPGLRHEMVLVIETRDDRVTAVRQYGDPLGPVRPRPGHPTEPLDLGPVGEPVVELGTPAPALAQTARALASAIDERRDDDARARLADDVVLHDVTGRRTLRGRDAYVTGMRDALGEAGHLRVDALHEGARAVIVEGAVLGREADAPTDPREHGFADVHRVVDGAIAETWHYVNRRNRPHPSPLRR